MTVGLPLTADVFTEWTWVEIAPFYENLQSHLITTTNVDAWLSAWTHLDNLIDETYTRRRLAINADTADEEAKQRFYNFLDQIIQPSQSAEQKLKEKLLASGLVPTGFKIPLRKMQATADLFHEENVQLLNDETKLANEYNNIVGAQSVIWDGEETTISQLQVVYQSPDRNRRRKAWELAAERQLQDRDSLNELWANLMNMRGQIAVNAGKETYRDYIWQSLARFDYTPDDCRSFHDAIESVVVPAATRIYERVRKARSFRSLRPWDLGRDTLYPVTQPPLTPFESVDELEARGATIFRKVDAQFGAYFDMMRKERLLDLENRKNKAPGARCASLPVRKRPYIFMNAIGVHDDVQTLLHETGHAFHVFESRHLPFSGQHHVDMEFNEVASMAMELLASPYLAESQGGFYDEEDASRALVEHLEHLILFWPYMATVDAFQHWVYENHEAATDPANCDAVWTELWQRFIPGVDWSGYGDAVATGWQRKQHIFRLPFYYIEYGLAQLGAVQVWKNALTDQAGAVAKYRKALSAGGTLTLPQLYTTAGAKFAFDEDTLCRAVELIETQIDFHRAKFA
jgi:oligoendopeptidase F